MRAELVFWKRPEIKNALFSFASLLLIQPPTPKGSEI